MSDIKFRIAAKTDVGCVRTNNEDNFQAAADLTQPTMTWVNNQTYDLGPNGALLVVADGMGGMNAGEVASAIAIDTVREYFTPTNLTPEVLKNRFTVEKFMKEVVVEADRRIKQKSTPETRGMGTTIVMAWLLDGQCYVCWCGDSRAYIYNPATGLFQVSKDHSYVQTLVDAGEISEEDAFDYPNSNVITRCLCDAKQKAEPDCLLAPQPLCDGDIILLCSDGLSGLLRDSEMQAIIEHSSDDMNTLSDKLIDAALAAGGNDNVTVAVAAIDSGGAQSSSDRVPKKVLPKPHAEQPTQTKITPMKTVPPRPAASVGEAVPADIKGAKEAVAGKSADGKTESKEKAKKSKAGLWIVLIAIMLIAGGVAAYFLTQRGKADGEEKENKEQIDENATDDENDEIDESDFESETAEEQDVDADAPKQPAPATQQHRANNQGTRTPATTSTQSTTDKDKMHNAGSSSDKITDDKSSTNPEEDDELVPVK